MRQVSGTVSETCAEFADCYSDERAEQLLEQRPGPDRNVRLHVMADSDMPDIGQPVQFLKTAEFAQSGVYFLILKGEVVYVGQATNMWKRIGQHMVDNTKWFDAVSCKPIPKKALFEWERYYIERLAPRYNRCYLSKHIRNTGGHDIGEVARPKDRDHFVSIGQAAEFLGITVEQLRMLREQGLLTKRRLPRSGVRCYHTSDLRAWAETVKDLV